MCTVGTRRKFCIWSEPSGPAPRDPEGKGVEDNHTAAAVRVAKSRAKKDQQEM